MFGQILVGTYPNRPHMFHRAFSYSEVQNKQVGKNKQVGWKILYSEINKRVGIFCLFTL
jgi:hypothetical protein